MQVSPQRVISLVPSQTELLFDLGLDQEIVGITKFCIHPRQWFEKKVKVGGTKNIHIEKVLSLSPDLIIANKEENNLADIVALKEIAPVWISDVRTLEQAYDLIVKLGALFGKEDAAVILRQEISNTFLRLKKPKVPKTVLYVIWQNPIMVAASDTFIDAMLASLGYFNAAKHLQRYPELSENDVSKLNPDLVFLSSEPYPFGEKHIVEFKRLLPTSKILLVDGEIFSWFGSRLRQVSSLESIALQI
jgi:ABC-type Fe3+-hydroxamate transport system substrate-binding protein